jgi:hypothetical protein
MATDYTKKRNIKYLNKDFTSLKRDIIEHLKIYFPDFNDDFNEGSVGVMLAEQNAFIGDVLSYYLDKQFQESFVHTATERKNVFKHARELGYKAYGKVSALGRINATIDVPFTSSSGQRVPDMSYAGTVKKGAQLRGDNGEIYETLMDINFSGSENTAVPAKVNSDGQTITFRLFKNDIDIRAGETATTTVTIGSYEAFKKVTLADDDIIEIISVKDAENNEWYEVEYLAQDVVFDSQLNTSENSDVVPYLLKLRSVPYRFVTEYDVETGKTSLIFGTGDATEYDGDLIPDLGEMSLPIYGKDYFSEFNLDPQNFLKTRTLGIAPTNTTLTITYRIGGGLSTNAGSNTVSSVIEKTFTTGNTTLSPQIVRDVSNSFAVNNPKPIIGGLDERSLDEVRQLISANYASQNRMVTLPDFTARVLSMPSKFGSVFRAYSKLNRLQSNAIDIHVLTKDSNGHVVAPSQELKNNLKKYLSRFRMATDVINIANGDVVNVEVKFKILTAPDFNTDEVLSDCILALKEYFEIDKWQINQPINKTSITDLIYRIDGVISVVDLNIVNVSRSKEGRTYSTISHNISDNTKNGIVYCKENAIFEIRYPDLDIVGSAQ